MKVESYYQTYPLNGAGIDELSAAIDSRLEPIGIERENRLRIRLSMEEALLRMRDHFGENKEVTLIIAGKMARPYVQIALEGPIFNPLSKTAVELEDWSGSLLTAVGLSPQYSYSGGVNTLRLTLPRQGMNPVLKMFAALVAGIFCGMMLSYALPEETCDAIISALFDPLYGAWYNILTVSAGPVIFFMTITTIINTGKIAEQGGDSRRMLARYIAMSVLLSVLALAIGALLFRGGQMTDEISGMSVREFLKGLLSVFPTDVFSPLISVNTPQILLLAFVLGNLLFAAGERAGALSALCRQFNTIGLYLADWISRLVPYMIFIFVTLQILRRETRLLAGLWEPLLLALLLAVLICALILLYVSRQMHVSAALLWAKVKPVFLQTIRKGSLDASFGMSEKMCTRGLGIERYFVTVGLPHGLVLYMPISALGTLVFTIYTAATYEIPMTPVEYGIVLVLATMLFVATPPVPGANLLAYAAVFLQMGFSSTALIDAMIFDIFFGIFAAAANQLLLELDLVLQASRLGLLDEEVLQQAAVE